MDDDKKQLQGSINRDRFKKLHKTETHGSFYSLDIDFCLVEKNIPNHGPTLPVIVAILDFKMPDDSLTFSEVLAYNRFVDRDIPVFIVSSKNDDFINTPKEQHRFDIRKYVWGDWRPDIPDWDSELVEENLSWSELTSWEDELRIDRRMERRYRNKFEEAIKESKEMAESVDEYELLEEMVRIFDEDPELLREVYE